MYVYLCLSVCDVCVIVCECVFVCQCVWVLDVECVFVSVCGCCLCDA